MRWNKLSDRIFFRTMFSVLGMRPVDRNLLEFVHYFQYQIGSNRTDYYLHFRREPFWELYKNEIFNKLGEFTGYDIARYLSFHYEPYTDKADFLRFLRYETSERIKMHRRKVSDWRVKLEMVLEWVGQQEGVLARPASDPRPPAVLSAVQPDATEIEVAETALKDVVKVYQGRIVVSDERSLDRIIELLLLLKDVRAPGKKISLLFRRFTQTDIASILLQFEAFKGKKPNTLQKRIGECSVDLRPADPKTAQMIKALTDFFY